MDWLLLIGAAAGAGLAAIDSATAAKKPFYLNLWFHISHAPMFPTKAQYQAYADWMLPPGPDGGGCAVRSHRLVDSHRRVAVLRIRSNSKPGPVVLPRGASG